MADSRAATLADSAWELVKDGRKEVSRLDSSSWRP